MHLLTASGGAWGLLALLATGQGRLRAAMGWMCLAVAIDAVDGALARRLRVGERLAAVDGALLDNLVDYLNYVVVPAFLLVRADLLPAAAAPAAGAAICVASAFQFSQVDAKAGGAYFKGFPSYWNVTALYLLLLAPPPAAALSIVAVLCALVFVPLRYVYPTRTRTLRPLTIALGLFWGAAVVAMVAWFPEVPGWLVLTSAVFPAYYLALSIWLSFRRDP